jgi:hypothetical protein
MLTIRGAVPLFPHVASLKNKNGDSAKSFVHQVTSGRFVLAAKLPPPSPLKQGCLRYDSTGMYFRYFSQSRNILKKLSRDGIPELLITFTFFKCCRLMVTAAPVFCFSHLFFHQFLSLFPKRYLQLNAFFSAFLSPLSEKSIFLSG